MNILQQTKGEGSAQNGTSTTLTVRVPKGTKDQLGKVARHQRRSKSFLAAAAIEDFLIHQDWQAERIREAIAIADQGDGIDHGAVMAWIDSWDTDKEHSVPIA